MIPCARCNKILDISNEGENSPNNYSYHVWKEHPEDFKDITASLYERFPQRDIISLEEYRIAWNNKLRNIDKQVGEK